MARCEWAHICDHAFLDQIGKPCIIGIFKAIFTERVPATHTTCALAIQLALEPGEAVHLRVVMLRPDRQDPLLDIQRSLGVLQVETHVVIANLANLPLPDFGPYEIQIFVNGNLAHTLTIHVLRRKLQ